MTTNDSEQENDGSNGRSELRKLLGGAGFIFGCRLGGAVATFLTQVLLARWMGAAELGFYVLAFAWCLMLSTFAAIGLQVGAIRFVGVAVERNEPEVVRGFVYRAGQITLGFGALIAVGGIGILLSVDQVVSDGVVVPLCFGLLAVPFLGLISLLTGISNGFSSLVLSFFPSNVIRPLLFLALCSVVWVTRDSLGASEVMLLQLLAITCVCAYMVWGVRRMLATRIPGSAATYDTRNWLRSSAPLVGAALFGGYFPEFVLIVAGGLLSPEEIAILHVSFRVALLISFGLFAIDSYVGPKIAQLAAAGNTRELQRVVVSATRLRTWPAVAAVIFLFFAGKPVLGIFGPEFVAGFPALIILASSQLVLAAFGPITRLLSVTGHQDRLLPVFGTALIMLVILAFFLVPIFGVVGAALAVLIDTLMWSAWMRLIVVKKLGVRPSPF